MLPTQTYHPREKTVFKTCEVRREGRRGGRGRRGEEESGRKVRKKTRDEGRESGRGVIGGVRGVHLPFCHP